MKVLVLGGAGFLGSSIAMSLLKDGHRVVAFDRVESPAIKFGALSALGDFFDLGSYEHLIRECDVVVHALGILNPGNSSELYRFGYSKELLHTVNLFDMVSLLDKKLIYISSGGTVYGSSDSEAFDESSATRPTNHYGAMKLAAEASLCAFRSERGAQMIVARLANPYGPGQDFRRGVGFISAAIHKTLNGDSIDIWGDGSTIRDYIYIEDVCSMISWLVNYQGNQFIFNLSSGVGTSQNDVIGSLEKLGLNPVVNYLPPRELSVDADRVVLDSSLICGMSNIRPISLLEGLNRYLMSPDGFADHLF